MQGLVSLTKRFCHFHEQGHVQKFDNKLHSHSVRERIWIEGSDLSQWLPQGERRSPKESKSPWIETFHGESH